MYQIEICNQQERVPLDEAFLIEVVESLLSREQVQSAQLSLAFVDNETIHQLNRDYLNHDYATDVLSFLLAVSGPDSGTSAVPNAIPRGCGKTIDGEVIVSTEMAAQMSAEFDWSAVAETVLYTVHGILHLLGYDDLTEAEQAVMRKREQQILSVWNLFPIYQKSTNSAGTRNGSDQHQDTGVAGADSA